MNITKEFQEWAKTYYPYDGSNKVANATYEILQANLSWLFPNMGNAGELLKAKGIKDTLYNYKNDPAHGEWVVGGLSELLNEYAAQKVAKVVKEVSEENHVNLNALVNAMDSIEELQKENESLKQRVKELEEQIEDLNKDIRSYQ